MWKWEIGEGHRRKDERSDGLGFGRNLAGIEGTKC
jgi:hypothetical protein